MQRIVTTSFRNNKSKNKVFGCLVLLFILSFLCFLFYRNKEEHDRTDSFEITPTISKDVVVTSGNAVQLEKNISKDLPSTSDTSVSGLTAENVPVKTNRVLGVRPNQNPAYSFVKHEADRIIVQVLLVTDATGGIAPIPHSPSGDGGNEDFLNSLTNEIVILETDSDQIKELKKNVIETRLQIKEFIENGGTFQEAIQEYRSFVNENANIRLKAIQKYDELKATDSEIAEEYAKIVNEQFEAEGVTPIRTSARIRADLLEKIKAKKGRIVK